MADCAQFIRAHVSVTGAAFCIRVAIASFSMRIVYLNPSGKLGGAETSLRELLASVRAAEPAWELWLVLGEDGPLAAHRARLGRESRS